MKNFGEDVEGSGKLEPDKEVVIGLVADLGRFLVAHGATAIEQVNAVMLILEAAIVSLYKVYNLGGSELPKETLRAMLEDLTEETMKACEDAPEISPDMILKALMRMKEESGATKH